MAMREKLNSWPLSLLAFEKRELVTLDAQQPIGTALKSLQEHNILCAPVYDKEKKEFVAMASMSDFMTYVAFGCFQAPADAPDAFEQFRDVDTKVGDWVVGLHDEDPSLAHALVFKDGSEHIMSVFGEMARGLHRVVINLEDGTRRIISQTDVIRFLFAYGPRLAKHGGWTNMAGEQAAFISPRDQTLEQSGIGAGSVFTVPTDITAVDAYRRMDRAKVRAAAVVDANGAIITTISVSDLRGLKSSTLKTVLRPVLAFLQHHRGDFHISHTCTKSDTLQTVMMMMLTYHVHRLWVVDDDSKPVGVVSMTDLIGVYGKALGL